ncbi:MAG: hypothetical protein CM15mP56_2830 [Alphaproteobacteria bacterium]|nr:MAG: hypothetical protein CM15mP56_2830 [Alphaproteobacteria bacterium]
MVKFSNGFPGPMLGRKFFLKFNKGKSTYSEERYHKEAERKKKQKKY